MSVPCEMLLHPELLSNQQLMSILLERQLRVLNIELMSRDALLELFHQFCVPYGQRRYRESGRGKILNKNRNLVEYAPEWTKLAMLNNQDCNMTQKHHIERIKPPPDLVGLAKRIKISCDTEAQSITQEQNNKRKTVMTALDAEPPSKKERKHNVITWP